MRGVVIRYRHTQHPPNIYPTGHIASHSDEDDPERLRFLLAKGEEHRLWILRKYDKPDPLAGGGGGGGGR